MTVQPNSASSSRSASARPPPLAQGEPTGGPDPATEPEGDLGGPAEPAPTAPEAPLDDNQRAAQLFDEGTALYRSQRWREAETYFQESFDLRPVFDTAANLGDCELHIEQFEEAAAHLTFAMNNFPVTGGEDVRTRLQERLDEARAKVGAVRLTVDVDGASVSVDGDVVGTTPLSAELFVMPGEHQIEVSKAGHETASQSLSIEAGSSQTVALALPVGGGGGTADGGDDDGATLVTVGGVALGVGLVGVGVGAVLMGLAGGEGGTADDQLAELKTRTGEPYPCAGAAPPGECADIESARQSHDDLFNGGLVGLVAGGAIAVGGAVMLIVGLTSDGEGDADPVDTGFWIGPDSAGLTWGGSF